MDTGAGTFAELQRHTDPAWLTAIWISHLHADHSADLPAAAYAYAFGGLTPPTPVPVYAPQGCAQRPAGFFGRPDPGFLGGVFGFRPLYDGHMVQHWNLRPATRAVAHDTEVYGLRAEGQGSVLAYSGDSRPCDALTEPAARADLFLCEADRRASRWRTRPSDAGGCGARAQRPPEALSEALTKRSRPPTFVRVVPRTSYMRRDTRDQKRQIGSRS